MIWQKLEAYLAENFADDGPPVLKSALAVAKYSAKGLDILPQNAKKEFAKILLEECPPQGPSRKIKTLEDFHRIMGLPTHEIKDTAFQELLREEHPKYVLAEDSEEVVNPRLDQKFLLEAFWSDIEKTFAKMEALLKIYRAKAILAEKNKLECSFIVDALSKEFEELHDETEGLYLLLKEDLGLERKKMRLKGFLSSSVVMDGDQKQDGELSEEQKQLKQAVEEFWQHIDTHYAAASSLFLDFLQKEFVGKVSREKEMVFIQKVKGQIDASLQKLQPEYAGIMERFYSDNLIRKSAVRRKKDQ